MAKRNMETHIIASIIGVSQKEIDERIARVKDAAPIMQLDIMDGRFVNAVSLYFDFTIPKGPTYEAHLMIEDPAQWIKQHAHKVELIYVHRETCRDCDGMIRLVKSKGKRIGFALNPETPVDDIRDYLDRIDAVLVMTVHPGQYGAPFLPEQLQKVRQLRELRSDLEIEVDGGITDKTIRQAALAGANLFISGSYLQNAKDPVRAAKKLYNIAVNRKEGNERERR